MCKDTATETTQDAPSTEAAIAPSSSWPRKKWLTPEEYLAFTDGPEMERARRRAVRALVQIIPHERMRAVAAILGSLTSDTIDAFFDYDREATGEYIQAQRPDMVGSVPIADVAKIRTVQVTVVEVRGGGADAVPADQTKR